jgi:hypothetical protein
MTFSSGLELNALSYKDIVSGHAVRSPGVRSSQSVSTCLDSGQRLENEDADDYGLSEKEDSVELMIALVAPNRRRHLGKCFDVGHMMFDVSMNLSINSK